MWRTFLILALAAACAASAARGEDGPAERRVLTIDEQAAWSGVGRLNTAAGGFCSGALIRPDTVLTAAHCVIDEATNEPLPPTELRFVAGLRAGVYTANRRAVRTAVHPDWSGYKGDGKVIVPGDIAVVTLESPISSLEAKSFAFGQAPLVGDDVTLVSYGAGRSTALSIQEPCQVIQRYNASAALNCDSVHGTSGSPVFKDGRIVGVISASDLGKGAGLSYAVLADGAIQALVKDAVAEGGSTLAPPPPSAAGGAVKSRFRSAPTGGSRLPGGKTAPKQ